MNTVISKGPEMHGLYNTVRAGACNLPEPPPTEGSIERRRPLLSPPRLTLFHHDTHLALGVFFTDDAPQVGDRHRELPVPVLGGDEALGERCVLRGQYRVDGGRVQLGEHGRGCARLVPEPHVRGSGKMQYHDTGLSLMWRRLGVCVCVCVFVRAGMNGKDGSGSGGS